MQSAQHTLDTNDIGQTEWLLASPLKNWKILLEQFFCMHAFPGGNYHNQNRAKCFLVFSPILLPTLSLYYAAIHQLHQSHPFNGPFPGLPRWAGTRKVGKTNPDFTEARDSEWQWHQLGHMQVCTSLQTDNHASTPPLSFLQAGCPACRPTNSVKALKAVTSITIIKISIYTN